MAEWEEQQAIVITWRGYSSILKEIVRYAKEEVTVLIVTSNPGTVSNYLENNGIDISENVEFVDAASNTIWVRDYGGNPVYVRDVDSLAFVDWIYNRPRPLDDVVPYAVAGHLNVPIHGTVDAPFDLVNTGGNYMSDGMGRGFSSNLVLTENTASSNFGFSDHDEVAVDHLMLQYMGVDEYVKMAVLPYDGIHHIFAAPTATVEMEIQGEVKKVASMGDGPVDATFKAIKDLTGTEAHLLSFTVGAITGGTDAQGECTVRLQENGREVIGQGAHNDIIVASAKAYINAINKMASVMERQRVPI
jgi:hypothetical protein